MISGNNFVHYSIDELYMVLRVPFPHFSSVLHRHGMPLLHTNRQPALQILLQELRPKSEGLRRRGYLRSEKTPSVNGDQE